MAFRSFEHGYWTIVPRFRMNELSGDQLIIPRRDGSWDDGGVWRQFHHIPHMDSRYHPPCARRMGRILRRVGIAQANFAMKRPLQRAYSPTSSASGRVNGIRSRRRNRVLRCCLIIFVCFRRLPQHTLLSRWATTIRRRTRWRRLSRSLFSIAERELTESIPLLYIKKKASAAARSMRTVGSRRRCRICWCAYI